MLACKAMGWRADSALEKPVGGKFEFLGKGLGQLAQLVGWKQARGFNQSLDRRGERLPELRSPRKGRGCGF